MWYLIGYFLILCIFSSLLYAGLSTSLIKRQTIMLLSLIICALFAVVYSLAIFIRDRPPIMGADFLGCAILLPQLIASIVNLRRFRSPLIRLPRSKANLLSGLFFVGFVLLLGWLALQPSKASYPEGTPIYDSEYYRSRIGILSFFIIAVILIIMISIQQPTIHSGGILRRGVMMRWSNFTSYQWKGNRLELKTQPGVFLGRIIFDTPKSDKSEVEQLLAQNIKGVSGQ